MQIQRCRQYMMPEDYSSWIDDEILSSTTAKTRNSTREDQQSRLKAIALLDVQPDTLIGPSTDVRDPFGPPDQPLDTVTIREWFADLGPMHAPSYVGQHGYRRSGRCSRRDAEANAVVIDYLLCNSLTA